jgi:hypothetical protein
MRVDFTPEGILLPELDLWLDPRHPVPNAWLSHAHSDHARGLHQHRHRHPITARIYRHRWPLPEGRAQDMLVLNPGESIEWRGSVLTARPAAHILGAAQLLVEYGGERLVYTGDIKHRAPICGWPTESVACDRLIIESTFGLPIYQFLEAEEGQRRIVAFAQEASPPGKPRFFKDMASAAGRKSPTRSPAPASPAASTIPSAPSSPTTKPKAIVFPGWMATDASDRHTGRGRETPSAPPPAAKSRSSAAGPRSTTPAPGRMPTCSSPTRITRISPN